MIKVDLFPLRDKLDLYKHWIFVSSDFDYKKYQLKTNPKKTIFVILDNSVDEIYQSCELTENSLLQSVLFLYPLKVIGENTFWRFHVLQSVELPNTLISLGDYCFESCKSLQSISLPNSISSLGDSCFGFCSSLKSINLPSSLRKLRGGCFWCCSKLSYVFIPKSIVSINSTSFSMCPKLFNVVSDKETNTIEIEEGSRFTVAMIEKCRGIGSGIYITP